MKGPSSPIENLPIKNKEPASKLHAHSRQNVRLSVYLQIPVQTGSTSNFHAEERPLTQFVTEQRAQSNIILELLAARALSANVLAAGLGLKSKTGVFKRSMKELLDSGLIAYTLPDKPNSRLQQYRLTKQGQQALIRHQTEIQIEQDNI